MSAASHRDRTLGSVAPSRIFTSNVDYSQDFPTAELALTPSDSSGSILVVDDEASVRNTIRRALESQGFEVLEASDGLEAMEQFGQDGAGIGLVILDIVMPRLSGWDVLNQMKSLVPDIPIILVSGYDLAGKPQESLAERADGVLRKPFELTELIDSVNRLL